MHEQPRVVSPTFWGHSARSLVTHIADVLTKGRTMPDALESDRHAYAHLRLFFRAAISSIETSRRDDLARGMTNLALGMLLRTVPGTDFDAARIGDAMARLEGALALLVRDTALTRDDRDALAALERFLSALGAEDRDVNAAIRRVAQSLERHSDAHHRPAARAAAPSA